MGNSWLFDVKYSLRLLRKAPVFHFIVIATIGVGMGINAGAFNLFNALLLRPLPVPDARNVVRLYRTAADRSEFGPFSYPDFAEFRDQLKGTVDLAAYARVPLIFGQQPEQLSSGATVAAVNNEEIEGLLVSNSYFSTLQAGIAAGYPFADSQSRHENLNAVAVLSYAFWQRRFGSDQRVLGTSIELNGIPFTVIGVASSQFTGTELQRPDVWLPLGMQGRIMQGDRLHDRDIEWLSVVGHLSPNVSITKAKPSVELVARQLGAAYPEVNGKENAKIVAATLISPDKQRDFKTIWTLMMAVSFMLLLIVCTNASAMLLARGAGRQQEFAIRTSLGAGRTKLFRQLIVENLVICTFGGCVGVFLATIVSSMLFKLIHPPDEKAFIINTNPNLMDILYTLGLVVLIGIGFGLIPVLQVLHSRLVEILKVGGLGSSKPAFRSTFRKALVVTQVALCFILLIGAGLLVRGLQRAKDTDPGFATKNVVSMTLKLRLRGYSAGPAAALRDQLVQRLSEQPGVSSVSLASTLPLDNRRVNQVVDLENGERLKAGQRTISLAHISERYFETLELPIVLGRTFGTAEIQGKVPGVIVNEAMAHRFWPGESPLGKKVTARPYPTAPIIGVVKDSRSVQLWEPHRPQLYLPLTEASTTEMNFLIRTEGDPKPLGSALADIVHTNDRAIPVSVSFISDTVAQWIWPSRVAAWLAIAIGALAALLAGMGLYGSIAYSISQRVREIGVRMALGAERGTVLRMVVRQGLSLALIGIGVGLIGSFAFDRFLLNFLYGLSPFDPITFMAVPAMVVLTAFCASYMPARQASKVDPAIALRNE